MLKELFVNKESLGFLSGENYLSAWQNFQKKIEQSDVVGIYHETYTVKAGNYEAVFRKMNPDGLSKALKNRGIDVDSAIAKNHLCTKVE